MAAAKAYTGGPDGDLAPYLSDDVSAQAWMFVHDTDGRLMEFYNDSLWPEGPHPGPVYEDSAYTETSDPYTDTREGAKPRGSIYFEVVFYHRPKRGLQPARGAKVIASHYRYGSRRARETETHIVPSTGLVALGCPFRGHYVNSIGGIESSTIGGWLSPVALNRCWAVRPSGSDAVTVICTRPLATALTVMTLPDTDAVTTPSSEVSAAKLSESPSGSSKCAPRSTAAPGLSSRGGIESRANGGRFGTVKKPTSTRHMSHSS